MRLLLAAVVAAVLACDGQNPGLSPDPDQSPEPREELDRSDYASEAEYYTALRRQAFREMEQMPPERLRAFMMENRWEERWPELWGPEGAHAEAERPQFFSLPLLARHSCSKDSIPTNGPEYSTASGIPSK